MQQNSCLKFQDCLLSAETVHSPLIYYWWRTVKPTVNSLLGWSLVNLFHCGTKSKSAFRSTTWSQILQPDSNSSDYSLLCCLQNTVKKQYRQNIVAYLGSTHIMLRGRQYLRSKSRQYRLMAPLPYTDQPQYYNVKNYFPA